jgi:serine/threonine-protein kinase
MNVSAHLRHALKCPKCDRHFDGGLTCPDDGTTLIRATTELDPLIGQRLGGRFTIRSKLGAGSMGTVYRASQDAMGREVAIKILRSDRAVDDNAKARFLREARTNSVLTSPHTVTVFDFGESDSGELYLAMELLDGENLGQRLTRQKRLSVADAIETARQALRSLAEAHGKGIVHRDLKPDNIFFARVQSGDEHEEIVKVLDFGIAKMLRDEDRELNAVETQAGTVFGTPRFMSPEQAQGKPLDARSDIYSLGVIMYHMLTGAPPFTDDDAILVMARHIKTIPTSPSRACPEAEIPPELDQLVMRVLSKDPGGRPATADVFSSELARIAEGLSSVTSGVRALMAQSLPPPPSSLDDVGLVAQQSAAKPTRRTRAPVIFGLLFGFALLILAGAVGAVLGKSDRGRSAMPPPSVLPPGLTVSTSLDAPTSVPSQSGDPATGPSGSVATFHPDQLPSVAGTIRKPPTVGTRPGLQGGVTTGAPKSTTAPKASASASGYTIFRD